MQKSNGEEGGQSMWRWKLKKSNKKLKREMANYLKLAVVFEGKEIESKT